MKISIHGLGYVGCVGVGCLSELGHELIGVDVDPIKVSLINSGKATIVEKDIDELIKKNCDKGLIKATTNSSEAIMNSDAAIICVGTPNDQNGHLDMSHIYAVARQVGKTIKNKSTFYTVAIRSTVMPGTNRKLAEIISSESGKKNEIDFAVVSNPEFLREGSAVNDFFNPPYTVIASDSEKGIEAMREVYGKINAEIMITDIGSAELIKFVNNSYHGLKVVFANEVGRICKALGVDSRILMDLFVKDKILNISSYYFKPGFAYGGSCLPKDLKALNSIGHDKYVKLPVLSAIETSNQIHIEYALNLIMNKNKRRIGFYGISFKAGTDDLRFSPALELAERLLGKGYEIKIYDKNVNLSLLIGKNKDFIFNKLPHINEILIENLDQFLESLELIIIVNKDDNVDEMLRRSLNKTEIIDLIRVVEDKTNIAKYDGICW
ncbi:MAG: nucleotide sugar dehydrogenase [Melioribacteraceae bacterium]